MKKALKIGLISGLLATSVFAQVVGNQTDVHDVSNSKAKHFTEQTDVHDVSNSKAVKYNNENEAVIYDDGGNVVENEDTTID